MDKNTKLKLIKEKLNELSKIKNSNIFNKNEREEQEWMDDTEDLIRELFGEEHKFYQRFCEIQEIAEDEEESLNLGSIMNPFNKFEEYESVLRLALKSLERKEDIPLNQIPSTHSQNFHVPNPQIIIQTHNTNQNSNTNQNYLHNAVSLDIKLSFAQIREMCDALPEKSQDAKMIVSEMETELKKDKPRVSLINKLLKNAFSISKDVGIALLPHVLEHWNKLASIFG